MRSTPLSLVAMAGTLALMGCSELATDPGASDLDLRPVTSAQPGAANSQGFPVSTYTPHHSSQEVQCNVVDNAIARIPQGDGIAPVTEDELGPGGWRFNTLGRSFVTFRYDWNSIEDHYDVVAGRSNIGQNIGTINDYPQFLDLPQSPSAGQLQFMRNRGEIILSGHPNFRLPGPGDGGELRINMRRVATENGDGIYEGCATTPFLTLFGFLVPEGGDFVQRDYFKAWARANEQGEVNEWEWTEITTFNNTDPEGT